MKRANQTTAIIDRVNEYLRLNHIKTENDPVFSVITSALLQAKTYKGYNLYTVDGKLSGGVNTDYIQLY